MTMQSPPSDIRVKTGGAFARVSLAGGVAGVPDRRYFVSRTPSNAIAAALMKRAADMIREI
jgi:hypothetical protein